MYISKNILTAVIAFGFLIMLKIMCNHPNRFEYGAVALTQAPDSLVTKYAEYEEEIITYKKELTKEEKNIFSYIERFKATALQEEAKYGIPFQITLAQGILESGAGISKLCLENKNHFGIKCFSKSCKDGHCSNFTDDSHKDFFMKYATDWESFRAHSLLLYNKRNDRYKPCFECDKTDYVCWAKMLQKCGYATSKKYSKKLIFIIENYVNI